METDLHKTRLELCFTEYETLQKNHLQAMKTDAMPDLAAMTEERDRVFMALKQNLDAFVGNAGSPGEQSNPAELNELKARLTSIMDGSQELSIAIQIYKDQLKTDLIKIQQGKTAMKGYKTANLHY